MRRTYRIYSFALAITSPGATTERLLGPSPRSSTSISSVRSTAGGWIRETWNMVMVLCWMVDNAFLQLNGNSNFAAEI